MMPLITGDLAPFVCWNVNILLERESRDQCDQVCVDQTVLNNAAITVAQRWLLDTESYEKD